LGFSSPIKESMFAKLSLVIGRSGTLLRAVDTRPRLVIPKLFAACGANGFITRQRLLAIKRTKSAIRCSGRPIYECLAALFTVFERSRFWFGELGRGGATSRAVRISAGFPHSKLFLTNWADFIPVSMSKQTRSGAKPFPSAGVNFSAVFARFNHKKSPVGVTGALAEGALFPTGDKGSVSVAVQPVKYIALST
jgi:hypothetical protein